MHVHMNSYTLAVFTGRMPCAELGDAIVEVLCIHAYIHARMHAYIHTYIHTYIHAYIHTYVRMGRETL